MKRILEMKILQHLSGKERCLSTAENYMPCLLQNFPFSNQDYFLKSFSRLNEIKNVPFPTVVSASLSKILCESYCTQKPTEKINVMHMALNTIIVINKRLQILSWK